MADRQPSLLTNSQREYLQGRKEGSAGRMARKRLKERVYEGLHDFPLLVDSYNQDRLEQAFKDRNLEENDHTLNVLSSAFAFLYLGITDTVEPSDLAKDAFEDILGSGIRRAYLERGEPVADVEVSIDVTKADGTKPLEEMTLTELQQLGQTGHIGREEFIETMSDRIQFEGEEGLSPPEEVEKSRGEWLADLFGIEDDEE